MSSEEKKEFKPLCAGFGNVGTDKKTCPNVSEWVGVVSEMGPEGIIILCSSCMDKIEGMVAWAGKTVTKYKIESEEQVNTLIESLNHTLPDTTIHRT